MNISLGERQVKRIRLITISTLLYVGRPKLKSYKVTFYNFLGQHYLTLSYNSRSQNFDVSKNHNNEIVSKTQFRFAVWCLNSFRISIV